LADAADIRIISDTLADIRTVISTVVALNDFCRVPSAEITDPRLAQADTDLARAEEAGLGSLEASRLARGRCLLWRAALGGDVGAFGSAYAALCAALLLPLRSGAAWPATHAEAGEGSLAALPVALSADREVICALLADDHAAACELLADKRKREERRLREAAAEAARLEEAARQEEAARAAEAAKQAAEAAEAAAFNATKAWLQSKPPEMEVVEDSFIAFDPNIELGQGSLKTARCTLHPSDSIDQRWHFLLLFVAPPLYPMCRRYIWTCAALARLLRCCFSQVVYSGAIYNQRSWVWAAVKRVPVTPGKGAAVVLSPANHLRACDLRGPLRNGWVLRRVSR
jgi:hypothetical protein